MRQHVRLVFHEPREVARREHAPQPPIRRRPRARCRAARRARRRPAAARQPGGSTGSGSVTITSSTRVSSRRPSAPPGWRRAKSSRAESLVLAAAPRRARRRCASAAVVLVVGARSCGQASSRTHASSATSQSRDSAELVLAGDRDGPYPESLQMFEQAEQLVGLARSWRCRIATSFVPDDAEVAVHALGGMQEHRRRAGRRERRGDLAADEPGLAHAGDDHAARGSCAISDTARAKASPSRSSTGRERLALEADHAAPALEDLARGSSSRRSCGHASARRTYALGRPAPTRRAPCSSSSANSRTAPRPPVRVSCSAQTRADLGHGVSDGDRQPDEPQHGEIRESRRRRTPPRTGAMPWRSSIARNAGSLCARGSCATSSTPSSMRAQPHALGHAARDDHDAEPGRLQQVDAEPVLDVVALELRRGRPSASRRDRCRRRSARRRRRGRRGGCERASAGSSGHASRARSQMSTARSDQMHRARRAAPCSGRRSAHDRDRDASRETARRRRRRTRRA